MTCQRASLPSSPPFRRVGRLRRALLLLCGLLSASALSASSVRYVGCPETYPDLESAVADSAPGDVIRLTGATAVAARVTIEHDLVVEGGWSCDGASRAGRTPIDISAAARAILVRQLLPTPILVSFRHLELDGGEPWTDPEAPPPAVNQGGVRIRGNVQATFDDVVLRDSFQGTTGGGALAIERQDAEPPEGGGVFPRVQLTGSELIGNSTAGATHPGGAIDCIEGSLFLGGSRLAANRTQGDGGAISLGRPGLASQARCILGLEGVTIAGNRASGFGGAIVARDSGTPRIRASILEDNEAGENGGALHATGISFHLVDTILRRNAAREGGAISLVGANLSMSGSKPCREQTVLDTATPCSGLAANRLTATAGEAVAVYAAATEDRSASVSLLRVLLAHHVAAPGSALLRLVDTPLFVRSSLIFRNTADHLVTAHGCDEALSRAFIAVYHATVRHSTFRDALAHSTSPATCAEPVPFFLRKSLIFDSAFEIGGDGNAEVTCLGTDRVPLPAGGNVWGAPVAAVFAPDGFHLASGSPAVDACDEEVLDARDLDGEERLRGQRTDAGADELRADLPLFADGFESASITGWAAAVGLAAK